MVCVCVGVLCLCSLCSCSVFDVGVCVELGVCVRFLFVWVF